VSFQSNLLFPSLDSSVNFNKIDIYISMLVCLNGAIFYYREAVWRLHGSKVTRRRASAHADFLPAVVSFYRLVMLLQSTILSRQKEEATPASAVPPFANIANLYSVLDACQLAGFRKHYTLN
jgi:hypothetical protein